MRRRRFVRKPKRKTTWLSGVKSACPEVIRVFNCQEYDEDPSLVELDIFSILIVSLDTAPGVAAAVSDVTCVRMVGDLTLRSVCNQLGAQGDGKAVTGIDWHLGIYFDDADPLTGAPQQPVQDPGMSVYQESRDWMWRQLVGQQHHTTVSADTASSPFEETSSACDTIHLDITVKRKLTKAEGIWLAVRALWFPIFNTAGDFVDGSFVGTLSGDLRALAALP